MKVCILAGGLGTRICEESVYRPKPMIEIGGAPILWHIMKSYEYYGYKEFVICGGYKINSIKEYFANYSLYTSDITFDFTEENSFTVHKRTTEKWKVSVVDTGMDTMTGGRIKRVQKYLGDQSFLLTYGDGVSDVNISKLIDFHREKKADVTMTAIQPGGKFGRVEISSDNIIHSFKEKIKGDGNWINGGFFVCEPTIFDYIEGDDTIWERAPLERLASEGKLVAYKHNDFWQSMDTLRDKNLLEEMIAGGHAPWIKW